MPHRCRLLPGLPGKCRTTIVAVTFFLVFDLGVLVLNFYPSLRFAEDAVMVKLSGRQRVLSQRTAKNVFQVEEAVRSGQNPQAVARRMARSGAAVRHHARGFPPQPFTDEQLASALQELMSPDS
ncbi:MAG: hypothetical protein RR758_02360 [Burkholderiaceae bacterium]